MELEPPSLSPLSLRAIGAPVMGGSPSLARLPPRVLIDLLEEKAIIVIKEEKKKKKRRRRKKRSWGLVVLNVFSDF